MKKNPLKQVKTNRDLEIVKTAFLYYGDGQPKRYATKAELAKIVNMTTHRHTLDKQLKLLEEQGLIIINEDGSLEATKELAVLPSILKEVREAEDNLLDAMKYKGERTFDEHFKTLLSQFGTDYIDKKAPEDLVKVFFQSLVKELGFEKAQQYIDEMKED